MSISAPAAGALGEIGEPQAKNTLATPLFCVLLCAFYLNALTSVRGTKRIETTPLFCNTMWLKRNPQRPP